MKQLISKLDKLTNEVHSTLRTAIENSKVESKHINGKAIVVNVFDYRELVLINNRLTFLDANGLHYSIDADCELSDLIYILNT